MEIIVLLQCFTCIRAFYLKTEAETGNVSQVIYRIKLPGSAILGEGKPENQNHAIIFTRGEGLQTIDMNQVRTFHRIILTGEIFFLFVPPFWVKISLFLRIITWKRL